jgi:hypothetical protein
MDKVDDVPNQVPKKVARNEDTLLEVRINKNHYALAYLPGHFVESDEIVLITSAYLVGYAKITILNKARDEDRFASLIDSLKYKVKDFKILDVERHQEAVCGAAYLAFEEPLQEQFNNIVASRHATGLWDRFNKNMSWERKTRKFRGGQITLFTQIFIAFMTFRKMRRTTFAEFKRQVNLVIQFVANRPYLATITAFMAQFAYRAGIASAVTKTAAEVLNDIATAGMLYIKKRFGASEANTIKYENSAKVVRLGPQPEVVASHTEQSTNVDNVPTQTKSESPQIQNLKANTPSASVARMIEPENKGNIVPGPTVVAVASGNANGVTYNFGTEKSISESIFNQNKDDELDDDDIFIPYGIEDIVVRGTGKDPVPTVVAVERKLITTKFKESTKAIKHHELTKMVSDKVSVMAGTRELNRSPEFLGPVSYVQKEVIKGAIPQILVPKISSTAPVDTSKMLSSTKLIRKTGCTPSNDAVNNVGWIGPAFLGCLPSAFAKTEANEYKSLAGRHLIGAKLGTHGDAYWHAATTICVPALFKLAKPYHKPMTIEDWLVGQPNGRANKYRKIVKEKPEILEPRRIKNNKRSFFIKAEMAVPPKAGDADKRWNADAYPRGIQALQNENTNIALGPFVQAVSKALAGPFMSVNIEDPNREWPEYNYTSGGDPAKLGQWRMDHDPSDGWTLIENDFSKFDSTQLLHAHKAELAFFKLFGPGETAMAVLKHQRMTYGFGSFHKYEIKNTRKSGDQNTSSGNTVINFVVHAYAIHRFRTLHPDADFKFSMLGLGDDNALAIHGLDNKMIDVFMKITENTIREMGLLPKLQVTNDRLTYCSSLFYPCTRINRDKTRVNARVLGPCIDRYLCKVGWSVKPLVPPGKKFRHRSGPNDKATLARLKGNALGQPQVAIIPIARAIHRYVTGNKTTGTTSGEWVSHAATEYKFEATTETTKYVREYYDISQDDIDETETFLYAHMRASCGRASAYWHPVIAHIFS